MSLSSMTGFARVEGQIDDARFVWEARSVNGKGLDLRFRLPAGLDALEPICKEAFLKAFTRGHFQINLTLQNTSTDTVVRLNESALQQIITALQQLHLRFPDSPSPQLENVLALKGVLDFATGDNSFDEHSLQVVAQAIPSLVEHLKMARIGEGKRLYTILSKALDDMTSLIQSIEHLPSRTVEAVEGRLKEMISQLVSNASTLDPQRLHQEAVFLFTKADVREEIDRLKSHLTDAKDLLQFNGAVGRKLEFLSQEFGREANTLCAKSGDIALTRIGLALKTLVDQFREQVMNVE